MAALILHQVVGMVDVPLLYQLFSGLGHIPVVGDLGRGPQRGIIQPGHRSSVADAGPYRWAHAPDRAGTIRGYRCPP